MKSKKTVIGLNTHEKELFEATLQAKINAFNGLLSYCQHFVPITDIKAFHEAPKSFFITEFTKEFNGQFPKIVTVEKQLELSGIELHKIESLESKYLEILLPNFDVETQSAAQPDFNIYCVDSAAEKRYFQTKKIVDLLNEFRNENTCYPANLVNGLNGSISFDFGQNKFVININFINSIPQRSY
jgi:hypothetical protein